MKYELKEGEIYCVKHKDYLNNPLNRVKRKFLYVEKRFEEITCYVFSAAIRKGRYYASVLSIPEYDLVSCEQADETSDQK